MTPNFAEKRATLSESSHLPSEIGKQSSIGPSGQGDDGWRASRLSRTCHPSGERLSSHAASALHPPLLSDLEERKLAERIKAGDQLAQQELVLANRKLVFRIVRDYNTSGLSEDDLIQEGSVGLIRAAQNFDPSTHAIRFSSYATFWIRAFIMRAVTHDSSLVRLPEYTRLKRERYLRAVRELGKQRDAATTSRQELPSCGEIAQHLGISLRQVERAWQAPGERALFVDQDEPTADSETAEHDLLQHEERAAVHAALRRLSPFEAWVIRERFGLGEWSSNPFDSRSADRKSSSQLTAGRVRRERPSPSTQTAHPSRSYHGRSFGDLSRDCGLSVHRIRLIERAALDKLRGILSPSVACCP